MDQREWETEKIIKINEGTAIIHAKDEYLKNAFVDVFHLSKCLRPYAKCTYYHYDEQKTIRRMVGSVKHGDGLAYFYMKHGRTMYDALYRNIYFSENWEDLWNFIDNDAIKIDCYTGLYFANRAI